MASALLHIGANFGAVGLALLAAYGWGVLVCRASGLGGVGWPVVATLGVASWIFVGGLLNLACLAYPWAFDTIVVLGVVSAVWHHRPRREPRGGPRRPLASWLALGIPWAMVAIVAVFVALTQVPPRAYNFHDDYLAYFAHPVRMLETGTVYGSALSRTGRVVLGGQAFLHGFALAHFSVIYINGADALFCLVLCLAMLVSFATRRPGAVIPASAAVVLAVAINPQYVNVSALYSGSAMCLVLLLLPAEAIVAEDVRWRARRLVPPSLVCAALVALKPTFLGIAVFAILFLAAAEGLERRSAGRFAIAASAMLGLSALFLLPWVAVHAPHYLAGSSGVEPARVPVFQAVNPLDPTPLFYGQSVAHYTSVMAIVLLVGIAFAITGLRPLEARPAGAYRIAAVLLATVATWSVFLSAPALLYAPPERVVRLFSPIAVVAAPAAVVIAWDGLHALAPLGLRAAVRSMVLAMAFLGSAVFATGLRDRVAQATQFGSILAFSATATSPAYLRYNEAVLAGPYRDSIARMQRLVPPGEPLLAWVATPFYLDFARNRVTDVDLAGLTNPWASTPPVRYVLWSYRGAAIRSSAACRDLASSGEDIPGAGERCATLRDRLATLAASGEAAVLADDGEMVLLELAARLSD